MTFPDHFSAVATQYAAARPEYPPALFDWIASIAPSPALCWEAGCGSGQATRDLALRFDRVHAGDPSAAQIAQAPKIGNVDFVVELAERCALPDASADVACVAQALHWFNRDAYFAEVARVLKPGGELILVNHIGAESGPIAAIEGWMGRRSADLGWRPEFPWSVIGDWIARRDDIVLTERRKLAPFGLFTLARMTRR